MADEPKPGNRWRGRNIFPTQPGGQSPSAPDPLPPEPPSRPLRVWVQTEATGAMDNMRRSFERPAEKVAVPEPATETASPMHTRDRRFYVYLAAPMAIAVGAVVLGIQSFVSGSPHWGFGLCVGGLLAVCAMAAQILEIKAKPLKPPYGFGALIGIAMLTWIFVGWQTWLWFHTPTQGYTQAQLDEAVAKAKAQPSGFTQQQVDEKISAATAQLKVQVSQLQAALADMTQQRDAALKQNPPQSLPPPSPISGPVTWDSNLTTWTTGSDEGPLLLGFGIQGRSSGFVDLKDAYIISDVTGEKRTLQISIAPGPNLVPISEINEIPPGAPIELWVTFKPPGIRPNDLLTQWHRFHFHAEYSGIVYDRIFDVTTLVNQFPGVGPHITKKVPAK